MNYGTTLPFSTFNPEIFNAAYGSHATMYLLGGILAAVLWTLLWTGLALWQAARNNQKGWFIFLLIVHTLGIFDILYLLFFRKNKNNTVTTTTVTHTTVASTPAPTEPEMPSLAPIVE